VAELTTQSIAGRKQRRTLSITQSVRKLGDRKERETTSKKRAALSALQAEMLGMIVAIKRARDQLLHSCTRRTVR